MRTDDFEVVILEILQYVKRSVMLFQTQVSSFFEDEIYVSHYSFQNHHDANLNICN